jgi:hypothetical protein
MTDKQIYLRNLAYYSAKYFLIYSLKILIVGLTIALAIIAVCASAAHSGRTEEV